MDGIFPQPAKPIIAAPTANSRPNLLTAILLPTRQLAEP
jgi:hypothetical protein